jgi:cytochrome b subunit of formate dehydrogenase
MRAISTTVVLTIKGVVYWVQLELRIQVSLQSRISMLGFILAIVALLLAMILHKLIR